MEYICKYCGKECKNDNSLRNHERLCRLNPNRQQPNIDIYYNKTNIVKHPAWNKGLTKENDIRLKIKGEKLHEKFAKGEITHFFHGKHHEEETKQRLSEKMKKYFKDNPEKIPYKLYHHSKKSYPETYFENVFKNDDVLKILKTEYPVGLYSLDFAEPNMKIDIEIDGEQHYSDKRIVEHDKIRSSNLKKLGWSEYRIRWSKYKKLTKDEQKNVIEEIKTLLINASIG
jgi:very-short-patch-repair endonuclease